MNSQVITMRGLAGVREELPPWWAEEWVLTNNGVNG